MESLSVRFRPFGLQTPFTNDDLKRPYWCTAIREANRAVAMTLLL